MPCYFLHDLHGGLWPIRQMCALASLGAVVGSSDTRTAPQRRSLVPHTASASRRHSPLAQRDVAASTNSVRVRISLRKSQGRCFVLESASAAAEPFSSLCPSASPATQPPVVHSVVENHAARALEGSIFVTLWSCSLARARATPVGIQAWRSTALRPTQQHPGRRMSKQRKQVEKEKRCSAMRKAPLLLLLLLFLLDTERAAGATTANVFPLEQSQRLSGSSASRNGNRRRNLRAHKFPWHARGLRWPFF